MEAQIKTSNNLKQNEFSEVLVFPYKYILENFHHPITGQLHQTKTFGGPLWPNWDQRTFERYSESSGINSFYIDVEPINIEASAVEKIEGRWWWGGAISQHFGHHIADFCTRIIGTLNLDPEAKFIFAGPENKPSSTPKFFWEILEHFNIPKERVKVINTPVEVASLSVVEQGETLHAKHPANARYLASFGELTKTRASERVTDQALYVSRNKLRHTNSSNGNNVLDEYLAWLISQSGGRVFYPEEFPLKEQLFVLSQHTRIIFLEGSSWHLTQLFGKLPNWKTCTVINRRKFDQEIQFLIDRFDSVHRLSYIAGYLSIFREGDVSYEVTSLSFPDIDNLLSALFEIHPEFLAHHHPEMMMKLIKKSTKDWISRHHRNGINKEQDEILRESFQMLAQFPISLQISEEFMKWQDRTLSQWRRTRFKRSLFHLIFQPWRAFNFRIEKIKNGQMKVQLREDLRRFSELF